MHYVLPVFCTAIQHCAAQAIVCTAAAHMQEAAACDITHLQLAVCVQLCLAGNRVPFPVLTVVDYWSFPSTESSAGVICIESIKRECNQATCPHLGS